MRKQSQNNSYWREIFVKHLLDADKWGFSIWPEFLRGAAQNLLWARTHNPTTTPGVNWAYKFVKRHPELCIRYNQRISYQRTRWDSVGNSEGYQTVVWNCTWSYPRDGIHEDDIWNFDETGAKRLLILYGHSSHQTAEFDDFCRQNAIICLCMPPHTSRLLQPLDVGVLGPLKRAYGI
jgi:hypothetical protein